MRRVARRAVPQRLLAGRLEEPWRSAFANSLVTPLNLYLLNEPVERVGRLGVEGDIVECGVYRGGSASVLGSAMMRLDGPARCCGSSTRSPACRPRASTTERSRTRWRAPTWAAPTRRVSCSGARGVPPERYELHVGLFEDTFPAVATPTTALLHVDCDFYEPVKLTLETFFPRMPPGGFVVLNDYGIYKGARQAVDEFLASEGLDVEPVAIDPTAAFFQKPGAEYSDLPVAGHFPGWPGAVA